MAEDFEQFNQNTEVYPWTDIPAVPLPESDPTNRGQNLKNVREINVGDGGDNVFRMDQQGLWLGHAEYDSAPFRVSMQGAVVAESLTVIGGTITGALIETDSAATTGIKLDTSSLRGYDISGNNTFKISTSTGFLQLFSYDGSTLVRTMDVGGNDSTPAFDVKDTGTDQPGYRWTGPSSGTNTANRDGVGAFYHLNNNCDHGDGFVSENTYSGWDGSHYVVRPDTSKNIAAFLLEPSSWTTVAFESRVTTEGYLDFPALYHCSEFDENPNSLSSTLIAKAYWEGGGTNGTQVITDPLGGDFPSGAPNSATLIRLSTTSTSGSDSWLKFYRSVQIADQSRWQTLLRTGTSKTDTEQRWGWYHDSGNYAYFHFDTAKDANKLYFTYRVASGSEVSVDLGYNLPTDGDLHKYTIQCYSGNAYIFIDDVLQATVSATMPQYGNSYFYVDNKSAANERVLDIEYAKHWSGRDTSF